MQAIGKQIVGSFLQGQNTPQVKCKATSTGEIRFQICKALQKNADVIVNCVTQQIVQDFQKHGGSETIRQGMEQFVNPPPVESEEENNGQFVIQNGGEFDIGKLTKMATNLSQKVPALTNAVQSFTGDAKLDEGAKMQPSSSSSQIPSTSIPPPPPQTNDPEIIQAIQEEMKSFLSQKNVLLEEIEKILMRKLNETTLQELFLTIANNTTQIAVPIQEEKIQGGKKRKRQTKKMKKFLNP